jgi:multidrug efflux pump
MSLQFELAPEEDQGYVMAQLSTDPGTPLEKMIELSRPVDQILDRVPEGLHSLVIIGQQSVNSGLAILMLKPWEERIRSASEIRASLNAELSGLTEISAAAFPQPPLGGGSGLPVELVIKTTGSYEDLYLFADRMKTQGETQGIISAGSLDLDFGAPRLELTIDRPAAQRIGVDPATISSTLASMLAGARASDFNWKAALYPVIVRRDRDELHGVESLDHIFLRTAGGAMVPLSSLVGVKRTIGALSLGRYDQERAVKLTAMPAAGHDIAGAAAALEAMIRAELPAGMSVAVGGAQEEAAAAQKSSELVFGLALLIVFFFLSAQFESFRDPAIILMAAPFAIVGGLTGLLLSGGTLNAYTAIALVTLVGMIAKHGILITEFANQRRDQGMGFHEGLLDATEARFRPILMTTAAAIAGAVPLLLASGPGSVSRTQIGIVIISGMALGTLVSMFLVPVAYSFISRPARHPLVEPPPASHVPASIQQLKAG